MERVEKGEKYWSIDKYGSIQEYLECGSVLNDYHYESLIYFHTEEETRAMRDKLRAVLKGAEVIEMPSEEEILKKSEQLLTDYYDAPAELCAESLKEWLNSQIVK